MTLLSSLTNRIFLAGALLVVASMGVAVYRVSASVETQAETDLHTGLAEAALLVDEFSRNDFQDFAVKARLIADLPVLRGAAATDDPPTVEPIAREYQARINADTLIVVGRGDRVLGRAGRVALDDAAVAGVLRASRSSRGTTLFWPIADGLLHLAVIPMDAGLATLIAGMSLDREAAMNLKAATNSDVAFVAGSRIVAASFDPAQAPTLLAVAAGHDAFTVPLGAETFIGRVQPLGTTDESDGPIALVLRSRSERLKFLTRLRWQIAGTGLAAVLGATLASYLVARTVTRPLRALTSTMGEMAATGDLARSLPPLGRWDDEDVRLVASTFHQLTSALDRFQREAAQRERLSSLGRLSAVVAHEIRNPLMIIKAAARTLRREPSPTVAAATQSIDEEVVRLNQVVAGVLDFARPIPFVLADADLFQICRTATGAAAATPEAVAPVFEDPGGTAPLVTDAERLRSVLVNVLTNAQHAVADRPAAARATTPIVLRAARTGDTWTLSVADNGIGIASDDLPRIFDPFFTARRGGSGIGLAISKNVVEGLGGTITAESRLGAGTTVTIALPGRAAAPGTPL